MAPAEYSHHAELMDGNLTEMARQQLGLASRRQLLAHDVSAEEIRWRQGRSWRLVLPGVLLLDRSVPTLDQREMAALLYAGPNSWLAGPNALRRNGIRTAEPLRRVYLLVPHTQRSREVSWVSVRRTTLYDERVVERGPLRWSCLPRSLVDSSALAAADDVARAMVIEAVQRRLVRLDDVAHWVEARRPNGRERLRQALAEAAVGAWSVPEADLGRLLASSRVLPPSWANPALTDQDGKRLTTPDLWLDDIGMAVMVQSRQFHSGVLEWDDTIESCSDLSAARVVVIGVTPEALAREPAAVLARVEDAYDTARRAGLRAPVMATARDLMVRSA